ncbi:MAG: radical SAM protein [Clostridiales bacterium]|nr:radical SAM protein [Clostridiales bacterium]
MIEPENAFEFLERLREKNSLRIQRFEDFSGYLSLKARNKGIPVFGQFELTPLCNLSCRMCYVHLDPDQMQGRSLLSADTWKDIIHQACEAGMCCATLTGGECLTYPGFDEVFLYLLNLGCRTAILTNGVLLNNERIQFFRKYRPYRIQVTLYGQNDDVYERVTGRRAFGTVIENIRKAIEAGLSVEIAVTPNSFLGEDVLETMRLINSLGRHSSVNNGLFTPQEETGRSNVQIDSDDEMYVRIYRLLDEFAGKETKEIDEEKLPPYGCNIHECTECGLRCGGGRSNFVVNWKGALLPCNRLNQISADILKDGFKAAWENVHKEAMSWPQVPECLECVYRKVCNTCAANMLRYAEPGKQPIGLCEQTKYFVKHGVAHIPECEA